MINHIIKGDMTERGYLADRVAMPVVVSAGKVWSTTPAGGKDERLTVVRTEFGAIEISNGCWTCLLDAGEAERVGLAIVERDSR